MEKRMAKTAATAGGSEVEPDPERGWKRLQEIGLVQIISIPFAILFGWEINLGNLGVMTTLVLAWSGYCCLRYGYDKRKEIWEQEENCPK
jgi:hypothetical protein